MSETPKYTESSGNVFKDLGLEDADELLAKAETLRRTELYRKWRPRKAMKPKLKRWVENPLPDAWN